MERDAIGKVEIPGTERFDGKTLRYEKRESRVAEEREKKKTMLGETSFSPYK